MFFSNWARFFKTVFICIYCTFICTHNGYCEKMTSVFVYGSYMVPENMHNAASSAKVYSTAELQGYRLDFNTYSDTTKGALEILVPDCSYSVWGVIWQIPESEMDAFKKDAWPEIYKLVKHKVHIKDNQYMHVLLLNQDDSKIPLKLAYGEQLPKKRLPSKTMMNEVIEGATMNHLPQWYIDQLGRIPTNCQ